MCLKDPDLADWADAYCWAAIADYNGHKDAWQIMKLVARELGAENLKTAKKGAKLMIDSGLYTSDKTKDDS